MQSVQGWHACLPQCRALSHLRVLLRRRSLGVQQTCQLQRCQPGGPAKRTVIRILCLWRVSHSSGLWAEAGTGQLAPDQRELTRLLQESMQAEL